MVEGMEVYLADADVEGNRDESSQELTVFTWVEYGWWQRVVTIDLVVVVEYDAVADFPDEVICGSCAIPLLQDISDAESVVLICEEASRALQLQPELHETLLGIVYLHNQFNYRPPLSCGHLPLYGESYYQRVLTSCGNYSPP